MPNPEVKALNKCGIPDRGNEMRDRTAVGGNRNFTGKEVSRRKREMRSVS